MTVENKSKISILPLNGIDQVITPCFLLEVDTTERSRRTTFLFNCCENVARIFMDRRMKTMEVEAVFITNDARSRDNTGSESKHYTREGGLKAEMKTETKTGRGVKMEDSNGRCVDSFYGICRC